MRSISKIIKLLALIIVISTVLLILGGVGLHIYASFNVNVKADEILFQMAKNSNVTEFYANGAPIGSDRYIPVKLDTVSLVENRKAWYSYGEIGDLLKKGFVAVEDHEFYEHNGVNLRRTMAALLNSIFKFQKRFGASTITQQVIKNISGDNDISFRRKFNEILRAISIEKKHTKQEILELYLNVVPMSENTVGVGLASRIYFDKLPSELDPAEAALLIGLANAPSRYNPYQEPEAAKEKRNSVLNVMHEHGIISQQECELYKNSSLNVIPRENNENNVNSWFIETVCADIMNDLMEKYHVTDKTAKKMITGGGLSIYTTQSIEVQSALESGLENTELLPLQVNSGLEYAAVAIDPKNGNLLGIVGQAGQKTGEWLINHATVPHIPASTIKPLSIYAPLIDEGIINWASVFDDVPISFTEKDGEFVEYPRNSPDRYDGLINIKRALMESKNTIAMRLFKKRDIEKTFKFLYEDLKMDTLVSSFVDKNGRKFTDKAPAPLAIGQMTKGVSLRSLVNAYALFSNEGIFNKSRSYIRVLDNDNKILLENKPENKRIFEKSTAQIMNQLLSLVVNEGTARSISLKELIDTAGKTGTSGLGRDKIFVGYTPYISMGIWCGYENGTTSVEGITPSHLEIWDDIAWNIHKIILSEIKDGDLKSFNKDQLVYLPYCKDSGGKLSKRCACDPRGDRLEYGYFSINNVPEGECDTHVLLRYDPVSGELIEDNNTIVGLPISLICVPERAFPKDIVITDSNYVYCYKDDGRLKQQAYIFCPYDKKRSKKMLNQ